MIFCRTNRVDKHVGIWQQRTAMFRRGNGHDQGRPNRSTALLWASSCSKLGSRASLATWATRAHGVFPCSTRSCVTRRRIALVRQGAQGLLDAFRTAAQQLEGDGVDGITTNCGFLSIFQDELSAAVDIPVLTSSLMQLRAVKSLLPSSRRVGILTVSRSS